MLPRILSSCRYILTNLKGCVLLFPDIFRRIGTVLYIICRYIQTRSCRSRGCPRHQIKIFKGQRSGVPRSLCVDRKRSLTPRPSSGRENRLYILMNNIIPRKRRYLQLQSPLFSVLPAEIRIVIYRYAVGGLAVHIFGERGRLLSRPLVGFMEMEMESFRDPSYAPLSLLRACRKVWAYFHSFHWISP